MDACSKFLSKSLQLESCVGILNLAHSHVLPELRTKAEEYITCQFSRVIQQLDFVEMPAPSLEAVLQSDELDVRCEECVFEALMSWVRARQSERCPLLARLLSHVRLPLLDPAYFVEKVESDELIRLCSKAFPLLQEARTFHLSGREVSMRGKYLCNRHPYHDTLAAVFLGGLGENQTSFAALSVGGVPHHRGLHKRRALHLHRHLLGPSQAKPAGGRSAAHDGDGGRVPEQEMGGVCLYHLPQ